jgi:hypothetical protein
MQIKRRIIWRAIKIASVAIDRVVACAMQTENAVLRAALEFVLEGGDGVRCGAESDVVEVGEGEPGGGCEGCEVAAGAAWVGGEEAGHFGHAVHAWLEGAEIDLEAGTVSKMNTGHGGNTHFLNGPLPIHPPP